MQIETKRLYIRTLSNEEMSQMIEKEEIPELKQAYSEMLNGCLKAPTQRVWYAIWVMQLKDDTSINIGSLSFKGLGNDGTVEIGYGIEKEYEGKGYMTEAVTAMSVWASNQEGVLRVEAETDPDNIASQKVLQKSGYVPSGIIGEEGPRYVWKNMIN